MPPRGKDSGSRRTADTGFFGRQHYRLRFTELEESFFGRLLLTKCSDPYSLQPTLVRLSLSDLFIRYEPEDLERRLSGVAFEVSQKTAEWLADALNALTGSTLEPHTESVSAFDYYNRHIESRLRWLLSGDPADGKTPCIESFAVDSTRNMHSYDVTLTPSHTAHTLAEDIRIDLELPATLIRQLLTKAPSVPTVGPRIDYRKQTQLLLSRLDTRQNATGEQEMVLLSNALPFRWLLQEWPSADRTFSMPALGTTEVRDKILLPLFLETNGLLDVISLALDSDPLSPFDVVVRYFVSRPPKRNIYRVWHQGLNPALREKLNEAELSVFDRLHFSLSENLVFGGKPQLERSYGELAQWLFRKMSYSLEEPSFLREPAQSWLSQHPPTDQIRMEDEFFLPAIYERLRTDFGSRVVKKTERFGGQIDILFDDMIPIELKVRRGRKRPMALTEIRKAFRPGSQAAAYSAIFRLGLLLVLDLPSETSSTINLDNCARIDVKTFPESTAFPTCIVVLIFHCHHPRPSSAC